MQADQTTTRAILEFSQGLLIVLVAGGLGGFVYGVASLIDTGKEGGKYPATKDVPILLFLFGKSLVGIGGGMAALLAALTVGRYLEPPKSTDLLSLAGLCFVAGYIGHRILPAVAARLEREVAETKKEVAQTKDAVTEAVAATKEAVQATEDLRSQIDMGREVGLARQVVITPEVAPAEVERVRASLERFRKQFPLDRSLHIVLAKMYIAKLKDRDKAIQILRDFIASKQKAELRDRDVADALFNIACYYSREVDGSRVDDWEEKALRTLKESLAITPENVADAIKDKDFDALKTSKTKEFQALIDAQATRSASA